MMNFNEFFDIQVKVFKNVKKSVGFVFPTLVCLNNENSIEVYHSMDREGLNFAIRKKIREGFIHVFVIFEGKMKTIPTKDVDDFLKNYKYGSVLRDKSSKDVVVAYGYSPKEKNAKWVVFDEKMEKVEFCKEGIEILDNIKGFLTPFGEWF